MSVETVTCRKKERKKNKNQEKELVKNGCRRDGQSKGGKKPFDKPEATDQDKQDAEAIAVSTVERAAVLALLLLPARYKTITKTKI
jgi:hypothetical protein